MTDIKNPDIAESETNPVANTSTDEFIARRLGQPEEIVQEQVEEQVSEEVVPESIVEETEVAENTLADSLNNSKVPNAA